MVHAGHLLLKHVLLRLFTCLDFRVNFFRVSEWISGFQFGFLPTVYMYVRDGPLFGVICKWRHVSGVMSELSIYSIADRSQTAEIQNLDQGGYRHIYRDTSWRMEWEHRFAAVRSMTLPQDETDDHVATKGLHIWRPQWGMGKCIMMLPAKFCTYTFVR